MDLSDGLRAKQVRLQEHEARGSSKDVVVMEQELIALRSRVTKMSSELQAYKEGYAKLESQSAECKRRMQKELDGVYANLKELRFRWAETKRSSKRELHSLVKEKKEKSSKLAAAETKATRQEALYYAVKRELTRVSTDTASKASKLETLFAQRLKVVEDRAAAAEASATASNALFLLVVGVSCGEAASTRGSSSRSLNDQLDTLRREIQRKMTMNETLIMERDHLKKELDERTCERDSAVEKAQSTNQSLEKTQTELRSRRASLAKLSEDSTHDMQNIARLRADLDCARRTAASASQQLGLVEQAHAQMAREHARVREESDAKTVAIGALQQAKRDAESQCNAARSRAARLHLKLAKGQQDVKEAADNLAATTLEAIVREKHDMKRSLTNAEVAKRRSNEAMRLLTDRCIFLTDELRAAATAEAAWLEERNLLRAALRDTSRELAEKKRKQVDEKGDVSDATEDAAIDVLVDQARGHMRAVMSGLPVTACPASQLRARRNAVHSAPSGSWNIFEVDGDEDLAERFDLHCFTRRISGLIEQQVSAHGVLTEDSIVGAIVDKVAELVTMVGRVEAASTRRIGEVQASFIAVSAKLAKLKEMHSPTEEASFELLAKKEAVVRLARQAALHAVEADLSELRIDDETCASAVRVLAKPDRLFAGDAWGSSPAHQPAKIISFDTQKTKLRSAPLAQLIRLTLSGNLIGDIGAGWIARTLVSASPYLVMLDLSRNAISMEGCVALENAAKFNETVVHVEFLEDKGMQSKDNSSRIIGWRQRCDWDKDRALRMAEDAGVDDEKMPLVIDVSHQRKTGRFRSGGVGQAALRAALVSAQPSLQEKQHQLTSFPRRKHEKEAKVSPCTVGAFRKRALDSNKRPSSAPAVAKPRCRHSTFSSSSKEGGVYEFAYDQNKKTVLRRLIGSRSSISFDERGKIPNGSDAIFSRERERAASVSRRNEEIEDLRARVETAASQNPMGAMVPREEFGATDKMEVLASNDRLLTAIEQSDYLTYSVLVDKELTCFEPEACGHLVKGIDFHKYYFDRKTNDKKNSTVVDPVVNVYGDVAVMAYVRLVQSDSKTTRFEETRVWKRIQRDELAVGNWRLVHFHRSSPKTSCA